jgi:hypothetical protein
MTHNPFTNRYTSNKCKYQKETYGSETKSSCRKKLPREGEEHRYKSIIGDEAYTERKFPALHKFVIWSFDNTTKILAILAHCFKIFYYE